MDEVKARIAGLEFVENFTVCRLKKLLDEVKKRHATDIGAWKETITVNVDDLVINVEVANEDSDEMSVVKNLFLACFMKHVHALQALVEANEERYVTLMEAMAKVRDLFGSGRSIFRSFYSLRISKLTREDQSLTGLVRSKELELESMRGFIQEASRSWKDFPKKKGMKID